MHGCIRSSTVPCAVGEVSLITGFSVPDCVSQLWEKGERRPGWVLHMIKCSCDISIVAMLWNAHLWYYCQHVSCGSGKMKNGDDLYHPGGHIELLKLSVLLWRYHSTCDPVSGLLHDFSKGTIKSLGPKVRV